MNVAYQNFSDTDSKPLTGRIKQGIFALVLKEITFNEGVISPYYTECKVIFQFPTRQGKINSVFSYTVTSIA